MDPSALLLLHLSLTVAFLLSQLCPPLFSSVNMPHIQSLKDQLTCLHHIYGMHTSKNIYMFFCSQCVAVRPLKSPFFKNINLWSIPFLVLRFSSPVLIQSSNVDCSSNAYCTVFERLILQRSLLHCSSVCLCISHLHLDNIILMLSLHQLLSVS